MKIMEIMIRNNIKVILIINLKTYMILSLKEEEIEINKLIRLLIIIINKTVSLSIIN